MPMHLPVSKPHVLQASACCANLHLLPHSLIALSHSLHFMQMHSAASQAWSRTPLHPLSLLAWLWQKWLSCACLDTTSCHCWFVSGHGLNGLMPWQLASGVQTVCWVLMILSSAPLSQMCTMLTACRSDLALQLHLLEEIIEQAGSSLTPALCCMLLDSAK